MNPAAELSPSSQFLLDEIRKLFSEHNAELNQMFADRAAKWDQRWGSRGTSSPPATTSAATAASVAPTSAAASVAPATAVVPAASTTEAPAPAVSTTPAPASFVCSAPHSLPEQLPEEQSAMGVDLHDILDRDTLDREPLRDAAATTAPSVATSFAGPTILNSVSEIISAPATAATLPNAGDISSAPAASATASTAAVSSIPSTPTRCSTQAPSTRLRRLLRPCRAPPRPPRPRRPQRPRLRVRRLRRQQRPPPLPPRPPRLRQAPPLAPRRRARISRVSLRSGRVRPRLKPSEAGRRLAARDKCVRAGAASESVRVRTMRPRRRPRATEVYPRFAPPPPPPEDGPHADCAVPPPVPPPWRASVSSSTTSSSSGSTQVHLTTFCPSMGAALSCRAVVSSNKFNSSNSVQKVFDEMLLQRVVLVRDKGVSSCDLPDNCLMNCLTVKPCYFSLPFSNSWDAVICWQPRQPWPPPVPILFMNYTILLLGCSATHYVFDRGRNRMLFEEMFAVQSVMQQSVFAALADKDRGPYILMFEQVDISPKPPWYVSIQLPESVELWKCLMRPGSLAVVPILVGQCSLDGYTSLSCLMVLDMCVSLLVPQKKGTELNLAIRQIVLRLFQWIAHAPGSVIFLPNSFAVQFEIQVHGIPWSSLDWHTIDVQLENILFLLIACLGSKRAFSCEISQLQTMLSHSVGILPPWSPPIQPNMQGAVVTGSGRVFPSYSARQCSSEEVLLKTIYMEYVSTIVGRTDPAQLKHGGKLWTHRCCNLESVRSAMLIGVSSGIIRTNTWPAAAHVLMANFTVMQLEDFQYLAHPTTDTIPVPHCYAIIQIRPQDNSLVHAWPATWACSSYGTVRITQLLRFNGRRSICFKLLGYASAAELLLKHMRMACALQKNHCCIFPASLMGLVVIKHQQTDVSMTLQQVAWDPGGAPSLDGGCTGMPVLRGPEAIAVEFIKLEEVNGKVTTDWPTSPTTNWFAWSTTCQQLMVSNHWMPNLWIIQFYPEAVEDP